uniref:W02B3.4-like N-terminal domain-containing protein n=1 Tax=Meloidogyne floridensis TaxID=298350 RepID=A0A915NHT8_9BILA
MRKDLKINYDTFIRPLIVDFNCLENQNNGKNCTYPVSVAIPDGYPQISNEFIEIKFILDISESRDFWLFKNVNNSTDLIATRGFNRSQSNIKNVEMPADWKAFKKDWKNGKYLECTPLLERPKYTRRAIPIKFLDRLVEFSNLLEKHNATAFLMGGTLLGWARECSLIPHTTDTDVENSGSYRVNCLVDSTGYT